MKAYQPLIEKYTRQATTYDRRWNLRWGQPTMEAAIEAVPWPASRRLLDVSCGTGLLEQAVHSRLAPGACLVGADISLPMLELARVKLHASKGICLVNSAAESMPFPSGYFDTVICNNSFHYYKHPQAVLKEFYRVLREGGCLVLSDWCKNFLVNRMADLAIRFAQQTRLHQYWLQHCYLSEEMEALLSEAGFRIESSRRIGLDLGWGVMVYRVRT